MWGEQDSRTVSGQEGRLGGHPLAVKGRHEELALGAVLRRNESGRRIPALRFGESRRLVEVCCWVANAHPATCMMRT
jgi:hypothetical protein